MIGDTSHDLLANGRNTGVDGLAVTYGAHGHEHLREYRPVACLPLCRNWRNGCGRTPDLRFRRPAEG